MLASLILVLFVTFVLFQICERLRENKEALKKKETAIYENACEDINK